MLIASRRHPLPESVSAYTKLDSGDFGNIFDQRAKTYSTVSEDGTVWRAGAQG